MARLAVACALSLLPMSAASNPQDSPKFGYTDTPWLPGGRWRVHDAERPAPPVVSPGEAGAPPSDAIVLFSGGDLSDWTSEGGAARWKVEQGDLIAGGGNLSTREAFGDCQLHLEWATPKDVRGEGQGRGNSGVFLMGLYEIQVLDSFHNRTYADGQAAALYGQTPPAVDACRPPGEWQSYDIAFRAPRFEAGELVSPAVVTVFHNGVLVHHAVELLGATRHREVASYSEHARELPLTLQDHGDPVRFRNIWIRR